MIKPYTGTLNKCNLNNTHNGNNEKNILPVFRFENRYYPKAPYNHTCRPKDNGLNAAN